MGIEDTAAQDRRAGMIDGLRQVMDFLVAHPEVPQPYHLMGSDFYIYLHGDDQRARLAAIARAMGRAAKRVERDKFQVCRQFGSITLIAQADRAEVCERVVVGTREVTREVPDPDAVAALPKVTVTEVVEDVTWVCPPSLLADSPDPVQDEAVA